MASTTSKAIAKAVKKVEELSLDREARIEYEFREKALKDYNSIIFDAKEEGIKKGIKEGEIKSKIEDVIAFAKTGGTAFPTCFICAHFDPKNTKESGNDCRRAASRTVMHLFWSGRVNRPDDGVSNRVVMVAA